VEEVIRVLFVEDSPDDVALAERELLRGGLSITGVRVETVARRAGSRGPSPTVVACFPRPSAAPASVAEYRPAAAGNTRADPDTAFDVLVGAATPTSDALRLLPGMLLVPRLTAPVALAAIPGMLFAAPIALAAIPGMPLVPRVTAPIAPAAVPGMPHFPRQTAPVALAAIPGVVDRGSVEPAPPAMLAVARP